MHLLNFSKKSVLPSSQSGKPSKESLRFLPSQILSTDRAWNAHAPGQG